MKIPMLVSAIAAFAVVSLCLSMLSRAQVNPPQPGAGVTHGPKSENNLVSYALGVDLARSTLVRFQQLEVEINRGPLLEGFSDEVTSAGLKLEEDQIRQILERFNRQVQAQQAQKLEELAARNAELGHAYLEQNKGKDGVHVAESGLQYRVIKEGNGFSPGPEDAVTVHYRGKLIDDTTFDSSYDRGQPVTFPMSAVIPGWAEGLQLMKVGGTYELVIPADLAYGPPGRGKIPPNAVLIFEVKLIRVK